MAEGEYRRLTCAAAGCNGIHKAQGYCLKHYRQWQRGGVKHEATHCAHCGAAFAPAKVDAIYCSKRCKADAWKIANPERHKELNAPKVSAIYAGYCEACSAAFVSRMKRSYCGEKCWPRKSEHKLGVTYTPPVRTCCNCGLQWSAIRRIGSSPFCPDPECQRVQAARARLARNGHKGHAERAKRLGRRYGHWNVLRVFERDRWRCQVCGAKTPKKLRGTLDPRAPELGHIVALAAGGDHVIENCQCECRTCNAAKRTRALGQLWLQGFADTK